MKRFRLSPPTHPPEESTPMIAPDSSDLPEDQLQNALGNLHRLTHMLSHDLKPSPTPTFATPTTLTPHSPRVPNGILNNNNNNSNDRNTNHLNALSQNHKNDNNNQHHRVPRNHQNGSGGTRKAFKSASSSSGASKNSTSSNEYTVVNEEEEEDSDGPETSGTLDFDQNLNEDRRQLNLFPNNNSQIEESDSDTNASGSHPRVKRSVYNVSKTTHPTTKHIGETACCPPSPIRFYNINTVNTQPLHVSNPIAYLDFTSSSLQSVDDNDDDDEENNNISLSDVYNTNYDGSDEIMDDLVLSERDTGNDLSGCPLIMTERTPDVEMNDLTPRQKSFHKNKISRPSPPHSPEKIEIDFSIGNSNDNDNHYKTQLLTRDCGMGFEDTDKNLVISIPPISRRISGTNSTPPSPSLNALLRANKRALLSTQRSISSFASDISDISSRDIPKRSSSGILRKSQSTDYTPPTPSPLASPANDHKQTGLHLDLNMKKSNRLWSSGCNDGQMGSPVSDDGVFAKSGAGRTNRREEYSPDSCVMFSLGPRSSSTQTMGSPEPALGVSFLGSDKATEVGEKVEPVHSKREKASVLRESLFLILSSLYGILVVLIGAVIPITDVFVSDRMHSNFEVFYVYLYTVSLLFLVYVYAYLLRRNRFRNDFINRSSVFVRNLSRVWSRRDVGGSTSGDPPQQPHGHLPGGSDSRTRVAKRAISLDMSNHHTGTFYLRLGVLGFGMGSMIHCGLQFGSHFSLTEECSQKLQMIKPLLHMIFAFFQLYFIFMNSKMCIHRYKKLARFGLMHMCATNICVWFRSIVVETVHVIHTHNKNNHGHVGSDFDRHIGIRRTAAHYPHEKTRGLHSDIAFNGSHSHSHPSTDAPHHGHADTPINSSSHNVPLPQPHGTSGDADHNLTVNCYWSEIMHKAADSAGPYLYPCSIEYSLMCACILYIMWKNVGQRPIRREASSLDMPGADDSDHDDKKRVHRMSVDCTSSSRGLFLGILTIVGSIISIIAFYMLVREPGLKHTAYVLTHVSETAVYLLTLIALIMASCKMKTFNFKVQQEAELEDILIVISYTGLVAFIVFSLMASIIHQASTSSILNIVSNIAMLVQATLQTIFMLAGDRMSAANPEQVKRKPGREFVTFMLISNFAMWAINTFETQTPEHNPIQVDVYGIEAWAIFTHISVPLGIYYRFHSTVCMSNIWKNAWKMKKHV